MRKMREAWGERKEKREKMEMRRSRGTQASRLQALPSPQGKLTRIPGNE